MESLLNNQLKLYFKDTLILSKKDIAAFYRRFDPMLTQTTLNWRIHCLLKAGIIFQMARGLYSFQPQQKFSFKPTKRLLIFQKYLQQNDLGDGLYFFDVDLLNPFRRKTIESTTLLVWSKLKDKTRQLSTCNDLKNYCITTNSKKNNLRQNTPEIKVFVLREISEAPKTKNGKQFSKIPPPEKIIVDMIVHPTLFHINHSSEISEIILNMSQVHSFNTSMIFRYAARRNRKTEIQHYLSAVLKF